MDKINVYLDSSDHIEHSPSMLFVANYQQKLFILNCNFTLFETYLISPKIVRFSKKSHFLGTKLFISASNCRQNIQDRVHISRKRDLQTTSAESTKKNGRAHDMFTKLLRGKSCIYETHFIIKIIPSCSEIYMLSINALFVN